MRPGECPRPTHHAGLTQSGEISASSSSYDSRSDFSDNEREYTDQAPAPQGAQGTEGTPVDDFGR